MSERAMSVRCIYCGTDKPPLMSTEHEDAGPWKCSECGENGFKEDFFVLQPDTPLKLKDLNGAVSLLNEAFEKGKREGIEEGRQMEREAVSRYFRKVGKPYYAAFFKEGEHLK